MSRDPAVLALLALRIRHERRIPPEADILAEDALEGAVHDLPQGDVSAAYAGGVLELDRAATRLLTAMGR